MHYLEVLEKNLHARVKKNPRYSLRAFAGALSLHPSALSRILAGKQLLSLRAGVTVAEKLKLRGDARRIFLASVVESHKQNDCRVLGQIVDEPALRSRRVRVPESFAEELNQPVFIALMELSAVADFRWDAEWISDALGLTRDRAQRMMNLLLKSGLLIERDGKMEKANRATSSADPKSLNEQRLKCQLEFNRLAGQALADRRSCHLTLVAAINPSKIEEAQRRFMNFLDEMSDLLETGEQTEVFAMNLQLFPFKQSNPS